MKGKLKKSLVIAVVREKWMTEKKKMNLGVGWIAGRKKARMKGEKREAKSCLTDLWKCSHEPCCRVSSYWWQDGGHDCLTVAQISS